LNLGTRLINIVIVGILLGLSWGLRRALVPHKSISVKARPAAILEEYNTSVVGEAISVETVSLI